MKTSLLRVLGGACVALVSVGTFGTFAIEPPGPGGTPLGGVQMSLTTGGYKFFADTSTGSDPGANGSTRPPTPAARDSFPASAVLFNRSNTDIAFSFGDPVSAQRHFRFRVFDSAGKEVWSSDDGGAPQVITEDTLARRSAWRRTVRVPLQLEGKPLAPGVYTLEALIDADKQVGATSVFEVVSPPNPDPKLTGIKGLVLQATGPQTANTPATELPVAGAQIVVYAIPDDPSQPPTRPPFFWQGLTTTEGRFQVNTPPGHYRVRATLPRQPTPIDDVLMRPAPLPGPSKTTEVTVEDGKFSEVTFHFPAPLPPPPPDTGIRGLVLIGPITPVARDGEPNEAPLAGAQVRVEEIRLPTARYSGPPFVWNGVTNAEGRFLVRTPAGKFRVTARQALVVIDPPPGTILQANNIGFPGSEASVEVTVEEGKFSEVTLHLDSGIR